MSETEVQQQLLFKAIHAASCGLLQFNFGKTLPPRVRIASFIFSSKSEKCGGWKETENK